MRIDPKTLPDGTVIETVHGTLRYLNGVYNPSEWGHEVTRVFVPAPEGMTYADAEAALADAGAWVEVQDWAAVPNGARLRNEWLRGEGGDRTYVHRDDLPTDPDAELVEAIAADLDKAWKACKTWDYEVQPAPVFSDLARAALAVVREHEATR